MYSDRFRDKSICVFSNARCGSLAGEILSDQKIVSHLNNTFFFIEITISMIVVAQQPTFVCELFNEGGGVYM